MTKLLRRIIPIVISVFAIALIGFGVYSALQRLLTTENVSAERSITADKEQAYADNEAPNLADDADLVFESIAEYDSYLYSLAQDQDIDCAEMAYYLPSSVPADAELVSITVNDGGTVFVYSLSRDADTDGLSREQILNVNIIECDNVDTTLHELLNVIVYKDVSTTGIVDTRSFVDDLADDLGIELYASNDFFAGYKGTIYVKPHSNDGRIYSVGAQQLMWYPSLGVTDQQTETIPGDIYYYYLPNSLNDSEIEAMQTLSVHTVNGNNE